MLVNYNNDNIKNKHVEFVSYTGGYPNLCYGVLTLKIDGAEYRFGHDYYDNWATDNNYNRFWSSGGECGFYYADTYCHSDEWIIDVDEIPEELKKYAVEIDEVFNSNVEHGCCGGCL